MSSLRFRMATLALGTILASLSPVVASGFSVYEQGAKASGQAVAFTARADDASANWYNPANIARFEERWLSVGFSTVFLGDTTFTSRMNAIEPGLFTGGRFDMVDNTAIPVHLHFVSPTKLFGKPFVLGVSLTTPFGLVTEWRLPFDGRFSGRKADLQTIVLNVNAAVDFGNGWAGALGLDYLDADLKEFTAHVGSLIAAGVPVEPLSDISGTGNELGWNAALGWKDDNWAIGVNYRSGFDVDLDGKVTFSGVPEPFAAHFPNSKASGVLKLPATLTLGAAYTGLKNWELEVDVHRIGWSSFSDLPLDFANPALPDRDVKENWKSSTSYRFGASVDLAERHELRFGAYVETTPIPVAHLRASIPDSDRLGYTLGYGFHGARFALDLYLMHIDVKDATTGEAAYLLDSTIAVGTYETSINLAGLTVSLKL